MLSLLFMHVSVFQTATGLTKPNGLSGLEWAEWVGVG